MAHIPVLQKEVLDYLTPEPNENFIDCTVGEGGHTAKILEKNKPRGKVLGIDSDPEIIKSLKSKIQSTERLILVTDSYTNLEEIVEKYKFNPVSGILFDLGLSSWHLEESGRGFSFLRKESLDMRYSKTTTALTAEKILNLWPQEKIEKILREYGEERYAKKISKEILEARKENSIKTTSQLAGIVRKAVPKKYVRLATTRTFQTLRIAVNNELGNLKKALPQTLKVLKPGGRLVIISFHSLEDRIVKNFLREKAKEGQLQILTKKPVTPSQEEIQINPRSRSAKLRAAIKI